MCWGGGVATWHLRVILKQNLRDRLWLAQLGSSAHRLSHLGQGFSTEKLLNRPILCSEALFRAFLVFRVPVTKCQSDSQTTAITCTPPLPRPGLWGTVLPKVENHRPGPTAEARGSGPGDGCPCHLPFPVVESRMDGPLGLATLPDPSQSSSGWEGVLSQRNYHQVPVTRRMLCRQTAIAVDCRPLPPSFRGNVSATKGKNYQPPFAKPGLRHSTS